MPTTLCIVPYIYTPGSYIVVGHDGYPEDQASYSLSLYHDGIRIVHSRKNYLKIPYVLHKETLTLVLNITFRINHDIQSLVRVLYTRISMGEYVITLSLNCLFTLIFF